MTVDFFLPFHPHCLFDVTVLDVNICHVLGSHEPSQKRNNDSKSNSVKSGRILLEEESVLDCPVEEETESDFPLEEETDSDFPLEEETESDFPLEEETDSDFPLEEESELDFPLEEESESLCWSGM